MKNFLLINNKKMYFSFFIFLFGISVQIFSSSTSNNLWNNLIYMITDKWFIMTGFLSISLYVSNFYEVSSNCNIVLRNDSLQNYVKDNIFQIVKVVFIYLLVALIICVIGTSVTVSDDFTIFSHQTYSIPIIVYFLFIYLRTCTLFSLLAIILYFIEWNYNKIYASIYCLLFIALIFFGIDVVNPDLINSLIKSPLLVTSYFKQLYFSNFSLEISATIIQILLLSVIVIIIYNINFRKNQQVKVK